MNSYKKYYSIVQKIKELSSEKDRLKKIVLQDLKEKGVMSSEQDGVKATMSIRQTVKYDKEGIQAHIAAKGIDSKDFEKTELDMSKVESLIAEGRIDPNEIAKYAQVKTTEALLIKESNNDS